jgi:hypothetical protein
MNTISSIRFGLVLATWIFSSLAYSSDASALQLGHDETSFTFAGRCPNGEPYRLFSYEKLVSGVSLPYYDYDAPVGKGTVQSDTAPKVMAVRICRRWAEIISTNYWE